MFTKSFRIIVTAVLMVSMTTLSMPMGIAHAAEGYSDQPGNLMGTSGDNLYFKKISEVPPPPPPPPEPAPEQEQDNGDKTTVGNDAAVADQADTTPEAADVPEADQDVLEWVFDVRPVRSETVTEPGGTRTDYYDEDGNLVGYSTQTVGTQYTQPTKWFDAKGKAITDANGNPFEATFVPAGTEQDTVKGKTNETAVWKKVTYSEDHKIETTSYYNIEGAFVGSVKKQADSSGKTVETWRTAVPTADQGGIKTKLGGTETPAWQEVTVSGDGTVTTTKYFDDKNNELGSKTVTKTPSGENAQELVDVTTWRVKVPAADQGTATTKLGEKPAWQEVTTSADGKVTTTSYFDNSGQLIGSRQVSKDATGKDVETWTVRIAGTPVNSDDAYGYGVLFGGVKPATSKTETVNGVTTTSFYDANGTLLGTMTKTPDSAGKEQAAVFKDANGNVIDLLNAFTHGTGTADQAYMLKALDPVTAAALLNEWIKAPGNGKFTDAVCFLDDTILTAEEVGQILSKMEPANADKILAALDTRNNPARLDLVKVRQEMMKAAGVPAYPGANGDWNAYISALVNYMKGTNDAGLHQMAWDLINNSLKDANSQGKIDYKQVQGLMAAMTGELKKIFRDGTYKLNLDAVKGTVVNAALNVLNSEAYKTMTDQQKVDFGANFYYLSVELTWRSANNEKNLAADPNLYKNIATFYKTMMADKSTYINSWAFQALMCMWRLGHWGSAEGNAAVVDDILKQSLTVSGGLQGLISQWKAGMDDTSLTGDQRAMITGALAQVIWQQPWLNTAMQSTEAKIDDAQMVSLAAKITGFLNGINDGTIKNVSLGMQNHLINTVGPALITIMNLNNYTKEKYGQFGQAYIDLANGVLTSGQVAYQTSTINVTNSVLATAEAKGIADLKTACVDVLLNGDFDMNKYLTDAKAQMGTTGNADYEAWVATGMNAIQKINLQHKDDPRATEVTQQHIETSLQSIKDWITNPANLKNMRDVGKQAEIYASLTDLLKEVCKDGSKIELTMDMKENIAAIFGTIKGLGDSKVKEMGTANANALVTFLRAQKGDQKDRYQYLANMIEAAIA